MEKSDIQLINEYLNGEEDSLKILVNRYIKPVYNFTYRLSGNPDEAQDITQETFLKVWRNLKKYDEKKKFSSWILTIARNTTIDWLRKKRPTFFSEMNMDTENGIQFEESIKDNELLPHEVFQKKENEESIEKALSSLSLNYREIILLHIKDELTFEEISEIVKKPMNTVKSQYRRGLAMMKNFILNAPKQL